MEELIVELRLFLELLDHEYLTSTVREKKAVLTNILLRLQSSKGEFPRLPPGLLGRAWSRALSFQILFTPPISKLHSFILFQYIL